MKRLPVLLVALALIPTVPALAQTTTSTTTTTMNNTTTTTTASTTTTTVADRSDEDECPFVECTQRPPDAFLGVAGGGVEVKAEPAGFCWRGATSALCVTPVPAVQRFDRAPRLLLRQGEPLSLRFAGKMAPTQITVRRAATPGGADVQSLAVNPQNPTQFTPDFPEGTHLVTISTRWAPGSAEYNVKLQVIRTAPPANPRRGPVTLTG